MAKTRAQAQRLIDGWLSAANASHSAAIAVELASGDWLTRQWLRERIPEDVNTVALTSYVVGVFRAAGHQIQSEHVPGAGNGGRWRIRGGLSKGQAAGATVMGEPFAPAVPAIMHSYQSYPQLGSNLQVKALALLGDAVVIHLRDDNGGAWQAQVVGYVDDALQ